MSIAMGTRLHINLYIYKTTSVPILVLLSQNAQSDEKVILSRCTIPTIVQQLTRITWNFRYSLPKYVDSLAEVVRENRAQ